MAFSQEYRLASEWAVTQAAGEPYAVVRLKNLHVPVSVAEDAWGRQGRQQPALISVECSFNESFANTASHEQVGLDTVHYGSLVKVIWASLQALDTDVNSDKSSFRGLRSVLDTIWFGLTGRLIDGRLRAGEPRAEKRPFLSVARVRFLSVSVCLPKASLLGDGISLTASSTFGILTPVARFGLTFRLLRLRVPIFIGLNQAELMTKQFVLATVEIDKFDPPVDFHASLEKFIVKTIELSSSKTLEALAVHLGKAIRLNSPPWANMTGCQIKIRLEKPTAVLFAECPEVEVKLC